MAELRTVRIGDLGRVVTGKTPPISQPELFGELHPFLTPTDIDGFARYIEPGRFLSSEGRDYQHRLMLPERAVCVVCIGATIGKVCMTGRPSFTNQQINSVVVNENEHDPFFVYHLMTTLRDELKSNAGGAATPIINKTAFSEIEVSVPPLPVQRRIAGILSAYDELIENSQRRIKILETMARALYREWFIHFRYPGSEPSTRPAGHPSPSGRRGGNEGRAKLVASPLGDIPHGWEVRKLADFVTTKYGYTESTNVEPVGPKYLRGMDINKTSFIDWSEVPYCPISPEDHEAYRLRVGDVLVIRMADPGKVGIVEQEVDAVFASYLIRVAPKDSRLSPYFLFYLMESAEYYAFITGASTGTTRKSASAGVIAEYQFVLPPQKLVEEFERRVSEIRSLLTTLLKKTVNLRRTRDLLLPRLLSGQVKLKTEEARA